MFTNKLKILFFVLTVCKIFINSFFWDLQPFFMVKGIGKSGVSCKRTTESWISPQFFYGVSCFVVHFWNMTISHLFWFFSSSKQLQKSTAQFPSSMQYCQTKKFFLTRLPEVHVEPASCIARACRLVREKSIFPATIKMLSFFCLCSSCVFSA